MKKEIKSRQYMAAIELIKTVLGVDDTGTSC